MDKSQEIFEKACRLMPGGVSSPVRAFRAVGMTPRFIERAKGSHIYDVDGHDYIDYIGSWGADDPGTRPPGSGGGGLQGRIPGNKLGAPTEGGGDSLRNDHRRSSICGNGTAGEFGNRGGDERHPCSQRLYGSGLYC